MTLNDIFANLNDLDSELTIYARRDPEWHQLSPAMVSYEDDSGLPPIEAVEHDMTYFLEVFLAKQIVEDWKIRIGDKWLSREDMAKLLIYYAENDAYPPDS